MSLLDALAKMDERFVELEALIVDPEVMGDQSRYTSLLKEHGGLRAKVDAFRRYRTAAQELADSQGELEVIEDPDERAMFEEEVERLESEVPALLEHVRELFATEDEDANRNALVEIRAGTGGDEAALFAGDLLRMYSNFAETNGWKVELSEVSAGTAGGYKEVTMNISGDGVFKFLRYESGGHRVQRVPETESQGRVHTSAATVAVLPEVDTVEVDIKDADLKIDTYRSSGPGGQSVNKTSSAIRITHEPTGIVVTCQDEKSQHKNRAKALKILASRLYEIEVMRRDEARSSQRKALIGSGDRSQRIRTYNYPQNRITDHRINLTLYSLDRTMQGDMTALLEPLIEYDKERRLEQLGE